MMSRSISSDFSLRQTRWPGANLYRNPFGEMTPRERGQLAVVELASIDAVVCPSPSDPGAPRFAPHRAYQIIGDCGRGKTTRMLAIGNRFPEAVYVYLPEDAPCPSIPDADLLLIDEAQRLPKGIRRQVFRSGRALVLATHTDLSRPLRHFGYQVTTETIGETLAPERLAAMLNRRIEASRREEGEPIPVVSQPDADELIRRFGTDIRAIEHYLYDLVQSQVGDHGEMRFVD